MKNKNFVIKPKNIIGYKKLEKELSNHIFEVEVKNIIIEINGNGDVVRVIYNSNASNEEKEIAEILEKKLKKIVELIKENRAKVSLKYKNYFIN